MCFLSLFLHFTLRTQEDVDAAVAAARAALDGKWRDIGAKGRRNLILKFADIVEKNADNLGKLER